MKQKNEKWYQKLRDKYRLVIFHDETFEEKFSLRLSRMNVFVLVTSGSVFLIFITSYIIAFTSLREYIPGYTDVNLNRRVYQLQRSADSLEDVFRQKQRYFDNIKRIIEGRDFESQTQELQGASVPKSGSAYDTINLIHSDEERELRAEFEKAEKYSIQTDPSLIPEARRRATTVSSFFTPVRGTVTNKFNPAQRHYGVDIVSRSNEAIKSTLEGTVVFADWTVEKGHVIGIQHAGNFVSVYKHNSVLLKREGDFVKAGEPIAIIGESGELSTGPHLHFELWFNAAPVNPEDYVRF
ncbi:MAG TPA: M23 family metallopeptidase [Bacteroidales bacterium]|nr:M23 family metallopeptidase [Bacteroidales bacterium]